MATTIEVESNFQLEKLLSTDPGTERKLRKLIREVLKESRQEVVTSLHNQIDDPRNTAKSVRRITYKKILGGNLNILSKKRASQGSVSIYEPPRKLRPGQRGGNRVPRGKNTQRWMSYGPSDRGPVLRWLSDGASNRMAGTRGGRLHGNRGSIAPRNLFSRTATPKMNRAADRLAQLIDSELTAIMGKM